MAEAGGLLHYETVHALTGVTSLSRVQFGLLMASEETYRVWREEFLTTLVHDELDRRLDALRDAIRARGKIDISIADVQSLTEQITDFRLDLASLSLLLKKTYGLNVLPDGRIGWITYVS